LIHLRWLRKSLIGDPRKAKKNDAYAVLSPDWIFGTDITGGFYATNPGDSVTAAFYPRDWQLSSFDDSQASQGMKERRFRPISSKAIETSLKENSSIKS